jgi:MrcB-like, N-terminal domain
MFLRHATAVVALIETGSASESDLEDAVRSKRSSRRTAAQRIENLLPTRLAGASVKPSVGQGNWASVPWIAVLHPAVTNSTQEGVYPVLLFHPDMESVEVTIAQGVTKR